jgi:hypothetical protein
LRIITTQQDFDVLRHARALPAVLLNQVENYFNQLKIEQDDEDRSELRLDGHGYIVVLEGGDNLRDLSNVGLSREDGGLLGSCPEYVELLYVGEDARRMQLGTASFCDHEKARRSPFAPTLSQSVAHPQPMPGKESFQARCGISQKNLPLLMIRFTVMNQSTKYLLTTRFTYQYKHKPTP